MPQDHRSKEKTLIMGVGNVLMGDEGIGINAIKYLKGRKFPEGVDLLDGGTGGFHLLSVFSDYSCVIMIDATLEGGEPGEIKIIQPKFAEDFPKSMTSHDIGLKDLIQAAELLGDLPHMHLITITVEDVRQVRLGVSDKLYPAYARVYEAILRILTRVA